MYQTCSWNMNSYVHEVSHGIFYCILCLQTEIPVEKGFFLCAKCISDRIKYIRRCWAHMDSTHSVWVLYCPGKWDVFSNLKFIFLGRYFNQEPSSLTIIILQRIFALYSHLESFFLPTLKMQHLCRLESTPRCLNSFKGNLFSFLCS